MSCYNYLPESVSLEECPCNLFDFPKPLKINAGLSSLPRQTGSFNCFRKAMLSLIRSKDPLLRWKAREGADLGIMLIEMWAYICDSIAFYDEGIANESYLRTASLRDSVRKLASLSGYIPRPAVASVAYLAAVAEGRQPVKIPSGAAFRSGSFDNNPPQVFETSGDINIHPYNNRWAIVPPVPNATLEDNPSELFLKVSVTLSPGMVLFMVHSGNPELNQVIKLKEVIPWTMRDSNICSRVTFTKPILLPKNTPLASLRFMIPTKTAGIRAITQYLNDTLDLDKLYNEIGEGDFILISKGNDISWNKIKTRLTEQTKNEVSVIVNTNQYNISGSGVTVTKIILDRQVNSLNAAEKWNNENSTGLTLHFSMIHAAQVLNEPASVLNSVDPIALKKPLEKPDEKYIPLQFFLTDSNSRSVRLHATLDYLNKQFFPGQGEGWGDPLTLPVEVFGNTFEVSRGETVRNEILGSGDASVAEQVFKLKKKPLTYLFSPSPEYDQAVKNSLEIRVDGILWKEVPNFYKASSRDQVYIVRQDDEGESFITFGNGISGQRLPTGTNNVVANYRIGAGKVSPPLGSVTQIAAPVKGLKSVLNPLAAAGGDDAESIDAMRFTVPRSTMLLGRIISVRDVEAVVNSVPGVRASQVEWRWSKIRQGAMIHVYYIGGKSLILSITSRLTAISEPGITYQVETADGEKVDAIISLSYDKRYDKESLRCAAYESLMNSCTGLLSPEVAGIGKPLYRSRLYKVLTSVMGISGVGPITWNGGVFETFAKCPEAGHYFDLESGSLKMNLLDK